MKIDASLLFRGTIAATVLLAWTAPASRGQSAGTSADVVVYKASPGGIMAAIAAAQDGASVVLLEPTAYVGGIPAQGGLTVSDLGRLDLVGGLSHQFFDRVGDYYETTYGAQSRQYRDCFQTTQRGGNFEPHVGEAIFEKMLAEQPRVHVIRNAVIRSLTLDGTRIVSATYQAGNQAATVAAKIFIDASYGGDLMPLAKVSYRVGTEAKSEFGESCAPDKASPAIQAYNFRVTMTRDPADQVPVPQPEGYDPKNYEALLQRMQADPTPGQIFPPYWGLPNNKIDANIADQPGANWGYPDGDAATRAKIEAQQRQYSLGWIYFIQNDPQVPAAIQKVARDYALCRDEFANNGNFPREMYIREARRLDGAYILKQSDQQGDRTKPDSICLGHRPIDCHATFEVREADGKIKEGGTIYVPVQPYAIPYRCLTPKPEQCVNLLVPVCMSTTHVAWCSPRMEPIFMMLGEAAGRAAALAVADGTTVQNVPIDQLQAHLKNHGAILDPPLLPMADFDWEPKQPKPGEPVHFRAKAVAGASKATTWKWNFDGSGQVESGEESPTHVFTMDKSTLVTLVVADANHQSNPVAKIVPVGTAAAGDQQIDSEDAKGVVHSPFLERSMSQLPFYGQFFFHDLSLHKGKGFAAYTASLQRAGTYAVYISSTTGGSRAKDVLVEVEGAEGSKSVHVDENSGDPLFGWILLGNFKFDPAQPAKVTIRNDGSKGYVVFDAVRWVLQPGATP